MTSERLTVVLSEFCILDDHPKHQKNVPETFTYYLASASLNIVCFNCRMTAELKRVRYPNQL